MAIPREIIDRILHDTDIVEIISESTTLKKTGANYKACCPFHNEKTPSFVVSPQKQIYHCFGCGAGGNVLGFVMANEKLDFIEAVKRLAERLNIPLPQSQKEKDEDPRDVLLRINSYTQWFFHNALGKATHALDYINKRGLNPETVERYALGFAPDSFDSLLSYLSQKKVPLDFAVKLGVIKKRDSGGHYDFFRNRLMFPIRNARGQFVGFSGRTLSKNDDAKYINSAESSVYNKGREVYGLFEAKEAIKKSNQVVLVEGNVDVLACSQLGVQNVVAPLGTSLTEAQVKLLKRYASDLILMFDGDDAGQKAALRAVDVCFAADCHPRVIILPRGKDPGEFLLDKEAQSVLQGLIKNAVDAMEWIFQAFVNKATSQPRAKAQALRGLVNWIKKHPDALERAEYQKKAAQMFDVSVSEIQKMLEMTRETAMSTHPAEQDLSLEARLICLFVQQPHEFSKGEFETLVNDFTDKPFKSLGLFVNIFFQKHETFDAVLAITEAADDLKGLLSEILLSSSESTAAWNVRECITKFKQQANKHKLKEITAQIMQAELSRDEALKMQLLKKKQDMLKAAKD